MNPVAASGRDDAVRPPLEEEVVHRVSWLIRLRWFAAAATIALTWLAVGLLGLELPVGGLTALGTGLYNIGISQDQVLLCEGAIREGRYLVLAHGTASAVRTAKEIFGVWKAPLAAVR